MHCYDKEFIQGPLPMTKQEVRAVSIAKLQLEADSVLLDIGAGTGSIGIEAARYLASTGGKVYAIEKEEKGLEVLAANRDKFALRNYHIIHGRAPEDLGELAFDRMFIGGSTGSMAEIVDYFLEKAKAGGILVANCIALESLASLQKIFKERKLSPEIIQMQVSRAKKIGPYSMMYGENPIYILKVKKGEEA